MHGHPNEGILLATSFQWSAYACLYFVLWRAFSKKKNPVPAMTKTKTANSEKKSHVLDAGSTQLMKGDIVKMSLQVPTKGRNKSGRSWKVRPQKRASSLIKTKANNQTKTWERRQQEKQARKEALELQAELREERRQAKVQKKERQLENERRRAENEFKNAQKFAKELNVGRLSHTLKAMSKKQLRQIKKTRLNTKTGVVEYVPAYSK